MRFRPSDERAVRPPDPLPPFRSERKDPLHRSRQVWEGMEGVDLLPKPYAAPRSHPHVTRHVVEARDPGSRVRERKRKRRTPTDQIEILRVRMEKKRKEGDPEKGCPFPLNDLVFVLVSSQLDHDPIPPGSYSPPLRSASLHFFFSDRSIGTPRSRERTRDNT